MFHNVVSEWIVKITEKASNTKITNHDGDCENEEIKPNEETLFLFVSIVYLYLF